jgi:hypothetical protein
MYSNHCRDWTISAAGSALSPDGTSRLPCRPGFFVHVQVLSRLFRRLFLEGLLALHRAGDLGFFGDLVGLADPASFTTWLAAFRKSEWVVYAKPPCGGPEAALAYLNLYTPPRRHHEQPTCQRWGRDCGVSLEGFPHHAR